MPIIRDEDRFLQNRNGVWRYYRRVPEAVAKYETRRFVRRSLKTKSLETARVRRDAFAEADDYYWHSLLVAEASELSGMSVDTAIAKKRYDAACARAMLAGFAYRTMGDLTGSLDFDDIAARLFRLKESTSPRQPFREEDAEALLGTAKEPTPKVSEVFQLYVDEIAFDAQKQKSPEQLNLWLKTKQRSLRYFLDVVGDLNIGDVTRQHGLDYRRFWQERLAPNDDQKPMSPKTANRHIGDIRALYNDYHRHIGREDALNPFRGLSFKETSDHETPAFSNQWVREKILAPGAFEGAKRDVFLIIMVLIETGARPGEIMNLHPGDIFLEDEVPYIRIKGKKKREIKAKASSRRIPLVGVALEATKRAPNGFPMYRDRSNTFSGTAGQTMESRGLYPTDDHVIYSFRHAFENRMKEARLDFELRCNIMGHKINRPEYGDGGSMAYQRDELLKIAHPFSEAIFEPFDA